MDSVHFGTVHAGMFYMNRAYRGSQVCIVDYNVPACRQGVLDQNVLGLSVAAQASSGTPSRPIFPDQLVLLLPVLFYDVQRHMGMSGILGSGKGRLAATRYSDHQHDLLPPPAIPPLPLHAWAAAAARINLHAA